MKIVLDALYTQYLSSAALYAATGGRWFPIEAPVGTLVPCCVASIISDINQVRTQITFEDLLVEISVLSDNYETMQAVSELVKNSFDGITLVGLTGFQQVGPMDRYSSQPIIVDGTYQQIIEYRLTLKKT